MTRERERERDRERERERERERDIWKAREKEKGERVKGRTECILIYSSKHPNDHSLVRLHSMVGIFTRRKTQYIGVTV